MNTRLKKIRLKLNLTMSEFGAKIGVKRNTISQLESGKNNITNQMILLISYAYNINEEWFRTGKGNMFIQESENYLMELKKQYALDDYDINIIESFLNMNPNQRESIKQYIKNVQANLKE